MRKIYSFLPLPFNKFAIFALYGLLSVALITSAQSGFKSDTCPDYSTVQNKELVIIGYASQSVDASKISWDKYDFVNIFAYPNYGGVYGIYPSDDELKPVMDLVKIIKDANNNTKTLLSLRNYNINQWPKPPKGQPAFDKVIGDSLKKHVELDGIDIEYPGMRGSACPNINWDEDDGNETKETRDQAFLVFLKALRKAIKGKTLMLTVGTNIIANFEEDDIDFLNIQTYHYSLYQNLIRSEDNLVSSYPNSPIGEYNNAYDGWEKLIIKNKKKIIMGVDFGNTIQIVDVNANEGEDISINQIIVYQNNQNILFDWTSLNMTSELQQTITPINDNCFGNPNPINLYSFPWNSFTKFFNISCADTTNSFNTGNLLGEKSSWKRNFDSVTSKTPWLYKAVDFIPATPTRYYYVSYEDIGSLRDKIESRPQIGGMSISDVSYDNYDDEKVSLLDYILGKKQPTSNNDNTDNSDNSNNTENKTQNPNDPKKTEEPKVLPQGPKAKKGGVIAGSVIGVLAFVLLIGAFGYRLRKNRLKSNAGDFNSKSSILAHATLKNELPPEPSPNRFVSPTSVIPVASGHVTAMFDFAGREETDLSFKKGDIIEVLEKGDGPNDWWVGRVNGVVGEFPGNYVKET